MSKLVVLVSFLAAFAAGLAVGVKWFPRTETSPTPTTTTRPSDRRGGWLASQLELTAAQQEQMKKIWSEMPRRWHDRGDRQLFRERDEAVAALIGPENKARYDEIRKQLGEQRAVLDRERKEAWQHAVDLSNDAIAALIGPESTARYEEIQKHLADQLAALERERQEWQEAWQHAVDQTKNILNAQQREKYETILKNQPWGSSPGGPRGGRDRRGWTREHGRPGGDRATSQPASAPENQT
jgi:Spy/CpxP family protein refolding chaperone